MPPFITALLLLADDHAAALVRRLGLFIVLGGVFLTTAGANSMEQSVFNLILDFYNGIFNLIQSYN